MFTVVCLLRIFWYIFSCFCYQEVNSESPYSIQGKCAIFTFIAHYLFIYSKKNLNDNHDERLFVSLSSLLHTVTLRQHICVFFYDFQYGRTLRIDYYRSLAQHLCCCRTFYSFNSDPVHILPFPHIYFTWFPLLNSRRNGPNEILFVFYVSFILERIEVWTMKYFYWLDMRRKKNKVDYTYSL